MIATIEKGSAYALLWLFECTPSFTTPGNEVGLRELCLYTWCTHARPAGCLVVIGQSAVPAVVNGVCCVSETFL